MSPFDFYQRPDSIDVTGTPYARDVRNPIANALWPDARTVTTPQAFGHLSDPVLLSGGRRSDADWRAAEGSPWRPEEPGPIGSAIRNALMSEPGQMVMNWANFAGPGARMPRPMMAPEGPGGGGIRAYHGSPHNFEKFSLDKIGTGEGAQAYGHGLYFAENEGVAKGYRDTLSRGGASSDGIKPVGSKGHMYEVNIRADPEHFLDWDKPLSQQSDKVRGAFAGQEYLLRNRRGDNLTNGVQTEADALATAKQFGFGPHTVTRLPADQIVGSMIRANDASGAAALREAGVPGIRYKDAGSRGAGGGTNNYVVFDDKLIDIIKKYGLAGLLAGGATTSQDQPAQAAP